MSEAPAPSTPPATPPPASTRVTLRTLRGWVKQGRKFPMLTCYDATTARWLWRGGVQTLLVGDTAGQVILGHDSTLPATMSFMLELTAAVRRGAPDAFLMADMPFGSYQCGDNEAVRNAMAFLAHGGADAVKLEVDATFAPLVGRMSHAGVPVVAHLGSRPQQVRATGGYHSVGRTRAEAQVIVAGAEEMIQRGCAMVLLEAVPDEVSQRVVQAAERATPPVPVVGCGGGPSCHSHVVVLQDLLGLSDWQPPFSPPLTGGGEQLRAAAAQWAELVGSGRYLRDNHPYILKD
jgi:3-methyl-2-oxobutanoate hydroxymethyltransferase